MKLYNPGDKRFEADLVMMGFFKDSKFNVIIEVLMHKPKIFENFDY